MQRFNLNDLNIIKLETYKLVDLGNRWVNYKISDGYDKKIEKIQII